MGHRSNLASPGVTPKNIRTALWCCFYALIALQLVWYTLWVPARLPLGYALTLALLPLLPGLCLHLRAWQTALRTAADSEIDPPEGMGAVAKANNLLLDSFAKANKYAIIAAGFGVLAHFTFAAMEVVIAGANRPPALLASFICFCFFLCWHFVVLGEKRGLRR